MSENIMDFAIKNVSGQLLFFRQAMLKVPEQEFKIKADEVSWKVKFSQLPVNFL